MGATKVASATTAMAATFNELVDDVDDITIGHNHTGIAGGGRKVSHGNLLDAAIGSGLTHAQLDAHVGSTPGTGSTGVHGCQSSAAVMGLLGGTQYTFQVGQVAVAGTITTTLDTIVGVVATVLSADPTGGIPVMCVAHTITNVAGASTFKIWTGYWDNNNIGAQKALVGVSWLAWGTKA